MLNDIFALWNGFNQVAAKCKSDYNINSDKELHPYDEKDKDNNFIVPQERVEADIKELVSLVMGFYNSCNSIELYDVFMLIFASYCNFYILSGLVVRAGISDETFFSLKKSDFTEAYDAKLLPYMQSIFMGIYKQDFDCFSNAADIIPEFNVAHIYLFVYNATHYFGELSRPDYQKPGIYSEKTAVYNNAMWSEYYGLNDEIRAYIFSNSICDLRYLPYIEFIDDNFLMNTGTIMQDFLNVFESLRQNNIYKANQNINKSFQQYQDIRLNLELFIPTEHITEWTDDFIKRSNQLNILNHAFIANSTIILYSFFENGRMAQWNYMQAQALNKKLKLANESKTEIFNKFSHDYKHTQAEALQNIAHSLLQMDEPELKEYGGKILLEYGAKTDLVKKLKMMQLQFRDDDDALRELIHESVGKRRVNSIVSIDDMLCTALRRCLLSLIYSQNDDNNGTLWDFCFPGKNISELRELAEKTVIFSGDNDIIKEWYRNNLFPLEVSPYSSDWKRVCMKANGYGAIVITNLLTELIYNVFRYADKNSAVCFSFSDTADILEVELVNTIAEVDRSRIDSTHIGLSSKDSLLKVLSRTCQPIEHHAIAPENTQYITKISLDKKLFFK